MTKILVDLERLKYLYCGLGQVSLHLGMALLKHQSSQLQFQYLVPRSQIGFFGPEPKYLTVTPIRRHFSFFNRGANLWHSTHQGSPYFPAKGPKLLLTIHDLNFLFEKGLGKARRRLRKLQEKVNRAQGVTVISKFTEKIVRDHLNVDHLPLRVIYNGVTVPSAQTGSKPSYVKEGPFLFSLGVIRPKKNFHVLVDMMNHLKDFTLIMAGPKEHPYAREIEERARSFNLSQRIILPGAISDAEKTWLYSHCEAFLYPSLYEGFGIPPIEAMSFGKMVFLSQETSLPEVGGVEAHYFQNYDPQEMASLVMQKLDENTRDFLGAERRLHWAQRFTWEKAAQDYVALYREILKI